MRSGGVVLAIDLATTFGWAVGPPGHKPFVGHGRFGAAGAAEGAVALEAIKWSHGFFRLNKPALVMIEEPILMAGGKRPTNKAVLSRLWGLSFLIKGVCHSHGVYDIRTATADQVRRHFIGANAMKGDKAKKLVQAQCEHLGWTFGTADEADSLALWDYGCEIIQPGSGHPAARKLFTGSELPVIRKKQPLLRLTAKEAAETLFKPKGRK